VGGVAGEGIRVDAVETHQLDVICGVRGIPTQTKMFKEITITKCNVLDVLDVAGGETDGRLVARGILDEVLTTSSQGRRQVEGRDVFLGIMISIVGNIGRVRVGIGEIGHVGEGVVVGNGSIGGNRFGPSDGSRSIGPDRKRDRG